MVESSKILTVSYGTFSCTLEGFDDSFGTMKAIAEYFRDLAQGDRYFGAEPPAPDAEMLTRIAEKEIARRVEARADESGIVLRAVDSAQAPVAAPVMPPVATPPSEEEVAEVATETAEEAVAEDTVAKDAPEADAAPLNEDDIAESTQAATADMDGDVAGPEAEDAMSSPLVASSPATSDFADTPMDDEMDVTAPAASFADMAPAAMTAVPAHPDANSVAAKLQRIRSVVGGGGDAQTAAEAPSFSDSFDANEAQEDVTVEDEVAEVIAGEDLADVEVEESEDISSDATPESDMEDVAEVEADVASELADTVEEEVLAEDSADASDASNEDLIAEADEAEAEADADTDAEVDDVADDQADEAEAPKQNFRARILRVAKKVTPVAADADLSADNPNSIADQVRAAAMAASEKDLSSDAVDAPVSIFEDIDEDEVAELARAQGPDTVALSDEDEAELLADLAAVEAEVAGSAPEAADLAAEPVVEDSIPEVAEEAEENDAPDAPKSRSILPDADDAAMSRIMDQADEQLAEPEGSRRRSAIAQLKAAVAATEAARQLGDKGDDAAAKESAFRDDLNDAVRPASTGLPRTEVRPERPRPAPLKLVASQRVDEDEDTAAEAEAVLPRRVSTSTSADVGSFTDFAAEMGATELPDLLEAAAAYTAYVEGIEDFSRPQIMKKVQASAAEEFSREDGLRSFGTLLRQGRISKVRNGRFQVSDQTRFKPEQKAG